MRKGIGIGSSAGKGMKKSLGIFGIYAMEFYLDIRIQMIYLFCTYYVELFYRFDHLFDVLFLWFLIIPWKSHFQVNFHTKI